MIKIYTKNTQKLKQFISEVEDFSHFVKDGEIIETSKIIIKDKEYKIGIYNVIVDNEGEISIHLFTGNGKAGRNSAVLQNTIKLFVKTINLFPVHVYYAEGIKNIYDLPKSNHIEIRMYKSLGAIIHDDTTFEPIKNLEEFLKLKKESKSKNKGNNPIFVDIRYKTIYLKFSAASAGESMFLLTVLRYFDNSKYKVYRIEEPNNSENRQLVSLINELDFYYNKNIFLSLEKRITLKTEESNSLDIDIIRNQALYSFLVDEKYDLFEVKKECAICGVTEEEIIEHAHILEVRDIKKMKNLTVKEKIEYANSPDNGILLCRNHHRLFDKHKFILRNNKFLNFSLSDEKYSLETKDIIKSKEVDEKLINDKYTLFTKLRYENSNSHRRDIIQTLKNH